MTELLLIGLGALIGAAIVAAILASTLKSLSDTTAETVRLVNRANDTNEATALKLEENRQLVLSAIAELRAACEVPPLPENRTLIMDRLDRAAAYAGKPTQ